jgi:hypothetical protein
MTTTAATAPVASAKEPAKSANRLNLSAFYAERARQFGEYVSTCVRLADQTTRALQGHLGPNARLAVQSLKPSEGQRQITPNGVLQENGVAVFGYAVDFQSSQMPPYVVHFFLSVGKLAGEKGKPDDWYVGHDHENFSMPRGGDDAELEPLLAHVTGALEKEIVKGYPIDAKQETVRNGAPSKNAEHGTTPAQDSANAKE